MSALNDFFDMVKKYFPTSNAIETSRLLAKIEADKIVAENESLRAKIKLLEYRQKEAQKSINCAATWLQLAGAELTNLEPPEEEVVSENPFMLSGEELERAIKKVHNR